MRILFAAMAESVHTARWINQIAHKDWDIHVFDFKKGRINAELSGATTHTFHPPLEPKNNLTAWKSVYPFRRGYRFAQRTLPPQICEKLFPSRMDTFIKLIEKLKPDILHSLEMQHESYPLLEAKRKLGGRFPMPWIYSSWGSDIYHFIYQTEHRDRIERVLAECDYHIADCQRDVELAKTYGFKGETLGVFPTAGGYNVKKLRIFRADGQISDRKTIALKGYENWAGRALTAIEALRLCADVLKDYTIEIYLADEQVRAAAEEFSAATGIPVKFIERTKNIEIIKLFGRARISIALSISDGSPNTLLEAMIMGAFPIQSNTVSTAEWIMHGENGFLVPPEDAEATAKAIRRAIADDELVNCAAVLNKEITLQRIDCSVVQPQVVAAYRKVFRQISV